VTRKTSFETAEQEQDYSLMMMTHKERK